MTLKESVTQVSLKGIRRRQTSRLVNHKKLLAAQEKAWAEEIEGNRYDYKKDKIIKYPQTSQVGLPKIDQQMQANKR